MENNEEEEFAAFEPYAILYDYLVNGKPEDMPDEVWVVLNWPYELVDIDTYNKIEAIKIKYPEYFPWEVKYRSIPQSVHDAYSEELHPGGVFASFMDASKDQTSNHNGIIGLINDAPSGTYDSSKPFTIADFNKLADQFNNKRDQEIKQLRTDKALWDKYYKPFNLPYRPWTI